MSRVKVKIKDIADVKNGSTPSTKHGEYYDGDIIWITPKDLSTQNSRYIYRGERTITEEGYKSCSAVMVPKGTVLLSSRAPIGLLSIAGTELCTNQGFKNIVPHGGKIDSEFLFYYLKTKIADIERLGSGTTFKEVSKTSLEGFSISIPKDISEQQKIAAVLSALDAKIELNQRINAELESLAKTLYDYWFVQFDFPNEKGKSYKSAGGKMVWYEELKREIPLGWEVKKFGDIASITAGGDKPNVFSVEKTDVCSVPIYSNGITDEGLYGYTDKAKVTERSITVSARGTIGYCILRTKPFVPIIRLIVITPHISFSTKYFEEYFKSFEFEKSGSVQQQLTVPQVSQIDVLYPPVDILKRYDEVTSPLISQIDVLKEESLQLAELRDWLLPMLMNGQVTAG